MGKSIALTYEEVMDGQQFCLYATVLAQMVALICEFNPRSPGKDPLICLIQFQSSHFDKQYFCVFIGELFWLEGKQACMTSVNTLRHLH